MALTGTDRGTFSDSTSSTSVALSPSTSFTAGTLAFLVMSVDNSAAAGASPLTSITDNGGNTWTTLLNVARTAGSAANDGTVLIVAWCRVVALTTSTVVTVNFSTAVAQKAMAFHEVACAAGSAPVIQAGATTSTGSGTTPTITTASLTSGDMVIGFCANEYGASQTVTQDADVLNGSWSSSAGVSIKTGSTTSGQNVTGQRKVVTATGAQTYNLTYGTSTDYVIGWVSIREVAIQAVSAVGAIASAEALGTPVFKQPQPVTAVGAIASGEVVSFPAGYRSRIFGLSGLVGYWRLGEPSGTTATDQTGAVNGTYQGSPTLGVPGATSDGTTAVTFNGSSQKVDLSAATAFNLGDVVTMEAWVNFGGSYPAGGGRGIISKGGGAYYMRTGSDGHVEFLSSQVAVILASSAGSIPASGWHHVVGTKNGATCVIYVDKVVVATTSSAATTLGNNGNVLMIGADSFGTGSEFFVGSLDEIALYSRDLTPTEVAGNYDAATGAPSGGLTLTPLAPNISWTGIASGEAFGTTTATVVGGTQSVTAVGAIASGEAFGNPALAPGPVSVSAVGAIASSEAVGTPSYTLGGVTVTAVGAIASAEALGVPSYTATAGPQTVTAVGAIASGEAVPGSYRPAPGTGRGTSDTTLAVANQSESWATIRARTVATLAVDATTGTIYGMRLQGAPAANQWASIGRSMVSVNVASIGRAVTEAVLQVTTFSLADPLGAAPSLALYRVTPADPSNPVAADYGTFDFATPYSAAVPYTSLAASGLTTSIPLNAAGISALNAAIAGSGIFVIGLANANYDAANVTPPYAAGDTRLQIYAADNLGTNGPVLLASGPLLAPGGVAVSAVGAIASAEALGTPTWTTFVGVSAVGAIASSEALGNPALAPGVVVLTSVGAIAGAEAFGLPTAGLPVLAISAVGAIASAQALGIPSWTGLNVLTNVGAIASAGAHGVPSWSLVNILANIGGIASGEAFGQLNLSPRQSVVLVGIPSGEAFGLLRLVLQALPWRRWKSIQYHALIYTPDSNGGPSNPKLELDPDILNLVWQQRMNEAGQAAFAMARHNKKLDQINWMVDHIKIFRESAAGTVCVFAGKPVKPLWSGTDVLVYCWDYLAFLQLSRTGYKTAYPTKLVGTEIISPEWFLAKNSSNSPFAFVATGTIENPLAIDGTTPIKTNSKFGVVDFDRLFAFSSIAQMAMANTANNVKFEITRSGDGTPHTFNFWHNYGVRKFGFAAIDPGNLASYNFDGGRDATRNDIATVLSDGLGGHVESIALSSDVTTTSLRRLQAALPIRTLFGEDSGATESDQGKAALARQLVVSQRFPRSVVVQPRQGEFDPFIEAELGDQIRHTLANANRDGDLLDAYLRLVAVSGSWDARHGELLQLESQGIP